jgi:hypothetical protein
MISNKSELTLIKFLTLKKEKVNDTKIKDPERTRSLGGVDIICLFFCLMIINTIIYFNLSFLFFIDIIFLFNSI